MPYAGEIPPQLMRRIIDADPQLRQRELDIHAALERSCMEAEAFMKKHGEIRSMRENVERSRAFMRGEITEEEFTAGNLTALEKLHDKVRVRRGV